MEHRDQTIRSTTIVGLLHQGKAVMGGDGQVQLGDTIMKQRARKIRRMYQGKVLAGFAGSAADGITLFERFEHQLDTYKGNLPRAALELAKEWRTDRVLRRLEAFLAVLDTEHAYILSGGGDVLEPEDGIMAIGSGAGYALAAARALVCHSNLSTREIVEKSIQIAASICPHTNDQIIIEEL